MNIYDIDQRIEALIDPETGEILDFDTFAELQMERGTKIENMALWYKNLCAEAEAIRAEEKTLADRRKAIEAKSERLKAYLGDILSGESFKSPKVVCSYRASSAVEFDDTFIGWAKKNADYCLRFKEPEPDKKTIADALKAGAELPGATLVQRQSLQIK